MNPTPPGKSPALTKVLEQVELVAPTDTTVLILGESGAGNCASIPRELFESEFFGHVKGSFTGAVRDRAGRFEMADGGTLFLDEVGEIPLEMQSKLLRVLQEGTYERIGEEKSRSSDVRIVAATNRNLQAEVANRNFREDLYYRLSVFPIEVVALRQRTEDIPLLVRHFLDQQSRALGITPPQLTHGQVKQLQAYDWPGNIRELQNVVQRAIIRARGGRLRFDVAAVSTPKASPVAHPSAASAASAPLTEAEVRALERDNLRAVLQLTKGKISGAGGAAVPYAKNGPNECGC